MQLSSPPTAPQLQILRDVAAVATMMKCSPGNRNRVRSLTTDTSDALSQTCNGLADLAVYLLASTHQFVMLGHFSTDYLEKYFSKLRQSAGGTYLISAGASKNKN